MNYLMRTHNDSHEFLLIHAVRNVFTTRSSNICNSRMCQKTQNIVAFLPMYCIMSIRRPQKAL